MLSRFLIPLATPPLNLCSHHHQQQSQQDDADEGPEPAGDAGFVLLGRWRVAGRPGYSDPETNAYDREAVRYLSWAMYPLLAVYAGYSLLYKEHRGWYSWMLETAVGAVYTFGFVLMCPQLWVNYRLKSVAHLPWRMLTYKFLNTIIDDLFAFVIRMPVLHRLSCFRDDAIFLIFLYQKVCSACFIFLCAPFEALVKGVFRCFVFVLDMHRLLSSFL